MLFVLFFITIGDTKLEANVYCFSKQCKIELYPFPYVFMQQNSWGGDVQTDTVADIHFTFNTQDLWITRCGTIHVNCQTRIVTIYYYDHRCQNMNIAKIKPPVV